MAEDSSKKIAPPNFKDDKNKNVQKSFGDFLSSIWAFFYDVIHLDDGLDKEGTIVNIKNNKQMAGANAWLLMCSIMIASLGLDLNSPAVIIGAMLISPLMSPILGVGLAIGINDKATFWASLQHFAVAIAIAIITSTLYFWLTPFGNETNEIIARTSPTLLDVLVAFFGGLAGIISGSRKDKSNAIPGVAIATALMPPLCVTGYGLANGNWTFMFNSFYLFFLNATFVAMATYLIVRFLKFPQKVIPDGQEAQKTRWMLTAFGLLMIIPSARILLGVLDKSNQDKIVNEFVESNFPYAIHEIERSNHTDSVEIRLLMIGQYFEQDSIHYYENLLAERGARNFQLTFLQDSTSRKAIERLATTQATSQANYMKLAEESNRIKINKDQEILQLSLRVDELTCDSTLFKNLMEEIKVLFPNLESISLSKSSNTADLKNGTQSSVPILILNWNNLFEKAKYRSKKEEAETKLANFIKVRVGLDTLKIVD